MKEVEKVIDKIILENIHRITNAMLLQIVQDISSPIIEAIAEDMNIEYEKVQMHFVNVMKKFEENINKR